MGSFELVDLDCLDDLLRVLLLGGAITVVVGMASRLDYR